MDNDNQAINRAVAILQELGFEPGTAFDLAAARAEEMLLEGFSDDEVRAELAPFDWHRRSKDEREFFDTPKQAFFHLACITAEFACVAAWFSILLVPSARTPVWPIAAFSFGVITRRARRTNVYGREGQN